MDESARIEAVVDRLGLVSRRIEVRGGSALAASLEFLDAFALPDWSPNGFFMRPLARRAVDDGIELMLTGEGGDNIFSTPMYLIADRVARGRLPSALSLIERVPHIAQRPWRSLRLRLLRDFGIEPLLPRPLHTRIAVRRERLPAHLNASARRLLAEGLSARRWQALGGPRWWAEKADHFARRLTLVGAGELFARAERLEGVHQRHPLLSLELVEFALRLPPEQQFDPHVTRPGQRRALRGRLPDEVLDASKVTFDALRAQSIQSDYEAVKWLLLSPDARIRAYTDADAVARLMDRSPGRWGDLSVWSDALMRLMVIESWLRYQEDPAFPRQLTERRSLTQAALVER
jgi:asparagine synthetase B (glutamine-hydrolysing)